MLLQVYVAAAKRSIMSCLDLPPDQAALLTTNHLDANIHAVSRAAHPCSKLIPCLSTCLVALSPTFCSWHSHYAAMYLQPSHSVPHGMLPRHVNQSVQLELMVCCHIALCLFAGAHASGDT